MTKSVTITAYITAAFTIVAVILAWGLGFLRPNGDGKQQIRSVSVNTGNGNQGTILAGAQQQNVTINNNYQVPDSVTKEAIAELQKKVDDTKSTLDLSRNDIRLLAQALKDLDQRTSGIKKLPDGRTIFGSMISVNPTVVMSEHQAAIDSWKSEDLQSALQHSQNATNAYEKSQEEEKKGGAMMISGQISRSDAAKLYYVGGCISQLLSKKDMAEKFAGKAADLNPTVANTLLHATTLANIGKIDQARSIASEVLSKNQNDPMAKNVAHQLGVFTLELGNVPIPPSVAP